MSKHDSSISLLYFWILAFTILFSKSGLWKCSLRFHITRCICSVQQVTRLWKSISSKFTCLFFSPPHNTASTQCSCVLSWVCWVPSTLLLLLTRFQWCSVISQTSHNLDVLYPPGFCDSVPYQGILFQGTSNHVLSTYHHVSSIMYLSRRSRL